MKKKYFSILALTAILISSTVFYNPTSASSNGFEQGDQYMPGAYDKQSESPTPYNWTRNSPFYSVESNPTLKWELDLKYLVRGNPTIGSDGTIYVPSAKGDINAVNNDGTLKWQYKKNGATDQLMGLSAVIGEDETLHVGNLALKKDGTLKWIYGTNNIRHKTAALDIHGNIVYTEPDIVNSLDPNGKLNWSYKVPGVLSSPSIGIDGTIYIGIGAGTDKPGVLALNPDGTVKWRYVVSITTSIVHAFGSIAIGEDGTLYFGNTKDTIHAVNPDGTEKWTYKTTAEITTDITIGRDGSIIFGSRDKNIYALNQDGSFNWKYLSVGIPQISPIVDKNGNIFFQNNLYELVAINSIGKFLWKYNLQSNTNAGSLAIGKDGTIYAVSGSKLTAITGDIFEEINYCERYSTLQSLTEEDLNSQEAIDKAKKDLQSLKDALNELENKINRAESSQQ
ncbi:PQQ-binding-like beta-propeller repeat protein [Psychrobacillus psychrotolerans]|uniref:outer membrane protein assembly factor BamB family protein n=1 Tax=Psychrobacillus psychrotolerans TaxID=126156 RepID=UPI003C73C8A8